MKKIILNTGVFFLLIACKAQTPVVSLFDTALGTTPNAYYKDTNNDLNKFVGTWLYTNGTASLKIVFQKRTMHHDTVDNMYYDMLVGEYEYFEKGVLKTNTLTNINNTSLNIFENTLSGNYIMSKNDAPSCRECLSTERRVSLSYKDPNRNYLIQKFVMRHYTELEGEFIQIKHFSQIAVVPIGAPSVPTLPEGTYILEKL